MRWTPPPDDGINLPEWKCHQPLEPEGASIPLHTSRRLSFQTQSSGSGHTLDMEPKKKAAAPPDLPRLIQDVLAELGYDADAVAVAERVRRLDIGLPVEDEFSVVCAWLGKCQLLHK